ncbi:HAD-IC family P-type ATPase [Rhodococcus sp. X156]|uniref:HAD-IC family P-type ATPase n=1 Tax=Rhodococcus sp. X156 TaxID=2499145 RepID=UPI000FDBAC16|nr:HAD-IC family P-type ATPase [Rhodococcus sp. X156]
MSTERPVLPPEARGATPPRGLSIEQVAERVSAGQTNDVPLTGGRTVGQIVRSNVFTRINAIYAVLLAIILSTGHFLDGLFGFLLIVNSSVGIVQEIRAKRTLDRLAIVGAAHPRVRRDGTSAELTATEVVLDDIIEVSAGDQIVVDGVTVEAGALEVDESMLTGESDPVAKNPGDELMSGSFVVSGSGAYQATKVGRDAYAARLAEEASKFTLVRSELRSGIDKILKFITYLLVPTGALTIYNQLSGDQDLPDALVGMVAALVPMVPEGLVLMTSIAFAVGVVRLGQRQCLVQELPAIEGLARVDVVCADKTGTLTEVGMRLSELRVLGGADRTTVEAALGALFHADPRPNLSLAAIGEAFPTDPGWTVQALAPFSSARKWSGNSFGPDERCSDGHWLLGAPDVLLDPDSPAAAEAEQVGAQGLRVLLLARSDRRVDAPDAPGVVTPCALVVLQQRVRDDARATLEFFHAQDVTVKVISGDNAVSVGAVASSLGLVDPHGPVDARELTDDPHALQELADRTTTFGRVNPPQKRALVRALQDSGHTVAMTGDGVNDVLALKDADIGVAMGSGSSAARSVAQIVLLDNKFATLPYVVAEGRRVIGNIERVSNLFLTKTVYSVLLALLVGLAQVPYPFIPRHVTIAAWFTIGIPAFVLSLAPNHERARSGFVRRVMRLAVPSGVVVGVATFVSYLLVYQGQGATPEQVTQQSTTALITLITVGLWVLVLVARPFAWWKAVLVGAMCGLVVLVFALPLGRRFFVLDPSNVAWTTTGLVCGAVGIVAVTLTWWLANRWAATHDDQDPAHGGSHGGTHAEAAPLPVS